MDGSIDPKVFYWTGAFVNMMVIAALAIHGVRLARRGEFERHARCMRAAAALVVLFLVSYAVKLLVLGREDLDHWGRAAVSILRFHELCVLTMLIAGGTALFLSRRLRGTAVFTRRSGDPIAPPALSRRHRLAGRSAVIGAILGASTAALVLAGMYARSGAFDAPALARHESGERE